MISYRAERRRQELKKRKDAVTKMRGLGVRRRMAKKALKDARDGNG